MLCSSARRARETLDGLVDAGAFADDTPVEVDPSLYGASATELLARLRATPSRRRTVLLIGHDPGISDLAGGLAGTGDANLMSQMAAKFPTGGLATLHLSEPWSALTWGAGRLQGFVVPRTLG